MNTHAGKTPAHQSNSVAGSLSSQQGHVQSLPFTDNRPEAITQRRLKTLMQSQPLKVPGNKLAGEPVPPGNFETVQKKENNTGLPDNLKTGIESLSGIDISDVKVHYNSEKPSQLQAHAYAQGSEIHVAPGQEQHLPHEAWHVVQQKQGRVKPTLQLKNGEYVNDDAGLEREADTMGTKAGGHEQQHISQQGMQDTQRHGNTIQRKIGFEFQAYNSVTYKKIPDKAKGAETKELKEELIPKRPPVGVGAGFTVEADGGATINEMEIVTTPVEETDAGYAELLSQMKLIQQLAAGIVDRDAVIELDAGGVKWNEFIGSYEFRVNGSVHFHPQATAGIKFENIADLIDALTSAPFATGEAGKVAGGDRKEEVVRGEAPASERKDGDTGESKEVKKARLLKTIGWSGQEDQRPFRDPWQKGVNKAKADLKGTSDSAIGLASLLYGFAEYSSHIDNLPSEEAKTKELPKDASYAKYFMPFMLRLGLGPHFKSLGDDEKRALIEKIATGTLKTPLFPAIPGKQVTEKSEFSVEALRKITVQDMINPLKKGGAAGEASEYKIEEGDEEEEEVEDALVSIPITNSDTRDMAGYGASAARDLGMRDDTDIGASEAEPKRKGAIIELRKLGNNITPGQLSAFALAVFELVRLIHMPAPKAPSVPATAEFKEKKAQSGPVLPLVSTTPARTPGDTPAPPAPPDLSPEDIEELAAFTKTSSGTSSGEAVPGPGDGGV